MITHDEGCASRKVIGPRYSDCNCSFKELLNAMLSAWPPRLDKPLPDSYEFVAMAKAVWAAGFRKQS